MTRIVEYIEESKHARNDYTNRKYHQVIQALLLQQEISGHIARFFTFNKLGMCCIYSRDLHPCVFWALRTFKKKLAKLRKIGLISESKLCDKKPTCILTVLIFQYLFRLFGIKLFIHYFSLQSFFFSCSTTVWYYN